MMSMPTVIAKVAVVLIAVALSYVSDFSSGYMLQSSAPCNSCAAPVRDKKNSYRWAEPHYYYNYHLRSYRRGGSPLQVLQNNNDAIIDTIVSGDTSLQPISTIDSTIAEIANNHALDVVVFILGVIPFLWATVEFWRRIALQLPFGTGNDSVVISIGEDNNPSSSRGRRTLGKGALTVAYILFGLATSVVGISLLSVAFSPSSQTPPPS
jgi:hypothetical protein